MVFGHCLVNCDVAPALLRRRLSRRTCSVGVQCVCMGVSVCVRWCERVRVRVRVVSLRVHVRLVVPCVCALTKGLSA